MGAAHTGTAAEDRAPLKPSPSPKRTANDPHAPRAMPSKEVRDAIIDSGMEVGMQEQMDLLEQIGISLR